MSSLVKDDCRSCFRTFQRFECNDCQGGGGFPVDLGETNLTKKHKKDSHGIGIFTYIHENHKNQPFMEVNIPYMDPMGNGHVSHKN